MDSKRSEITRRAALLVVAFFVSLFAAMAGQPTNILLNPGGVSLIYPPFDVSGWKLTQYFTPPTQPRDHNGDDYYAQDWARGCGATAGHNVFAGFSGLIVIAADHGTKDYGKTVVIYDRESNFALRYGHLDTMSVAVGQVVIAGVTKLGTVGNTGNTRSLSCSVSPGAHLHLALYRNVGDPNAEPVTFVSIATAQATQYAADFSFATSIRLIKGNQSPTVYAYNGVKDPVSAFVYENQGWGFWAATNVSPSPAPFNPVGTYTQSSVDAVQTGLHYPPRDGTLVRGQNNATVFYVSDGVKYGVPGSIFSCRGFNFGAVQQVAQSEIDDYPPGTVVPVLTGCTNPDIQAQNDMMNAAVREPRVARQGSFLSVYAGTYGKNLNWDPSWELRLMAFLFNSHSKGTGMVYYNQATNKSDQTIRYVSFYDPDLSAWTSWHPAY